MYGVHQLPSTTVYFHLNDGEQTNAVALLCKKVSEIIKYLHRPYFIIISSSKRVVTTNMETWPRTAGGRSLQPQTSGIYSEQTNGFCDLSPIIHIKCTLLLLWRKVLMVGVKRRTETCFSILETRWLLETLKGSWSADRAFDPCLQFKKNEQKLEKDLSSQCINLTTTQNL